MDKPIAELKRDVASAKAEADAAAKRYANADVAAKEAKSAFDAALEAVNEAENALEHAKLRTKKLTPYQEGILAKLRDGWTIRVSRKWGGGGLAYWWRRPDDAFCAEKHPREDSVLFLYKRGLLVHEGAVGWGSDATYRIKKGV